MVYISSVITLTNVYYVVMSKFFVSRSRVPTLDKKLTNGLRWFTIGTNEYVQMYKIYIILHVQTMLT